MYRLKCTCTFIADLILKTSQSLYLDRLYSSLQSGLFFCFENDLGEQ